MNRPDDQQNPPSTAPPLFLEQHIEKFDSAWSQVHIGAPRPEIENYLRGLAEPARAVLLKRLLITELQWRRKLGEISSLQDYLTRFPNHVTELIEVFNDATCRNATHQGEMQLTEEYALGEILPLSESEPRRSRVGTTEATELPNIDRFRIEREIGAGAMGNVYRAFDRTLGASVALKLLPRIDAIAIHRFKHEFRALADVLHPNLVRLYDFFVHEGRWFFTMELVDGVNFLAYSRPKSGAQSMDSTDDETSPTEPNILLRPSHPSASTDPISHPSWIPVDIDRLRESLRQLTEGLCALHDAGKLHRDVKPSNVIVTKEGRVVVLDFGLAADLDEHGIHESTEHHFAGTLAYMSPEQMMSRPLSAASDWYSVGVMLYQVLTGQLPFRGTLVEILQAKEKVLPVSPRELVPSLPDDLTSLCMDLLCARADARANGRDILRRLGGTSLPVRPISTGITKADRVLFVGREQQLSVLETGLSDVQQGRAANILIHGVSGIGKTALVQRFLERLAEREDVLVLTGRCYERESVPFKALDDLIDALCKYMRRLQRRQAEALLPRDVWTLARLFPALDRVEAIAKAPRRAFETPDQQVLRRRAFAALRELLTRLGDRRPLVIHIDDLQWGDVDSAVLLLELLRPPDPPPLLFLASYRTADATASPFLQSLLHITERAAPDLHWREIELKPLTDGESRHLVSELVDQLGPDLRPHAEAIAEEAGGSPFFIGELARFIAADRFAIKPLEPERVELEAVIWTRIGQLPSSARKLLEVLAVAGQPIARTDAFQAAELSGDDRSALDHLRAAHFVRLTGTSDREEFETYHDRIRETVVARLLPAALADHHKRLATTLERSGGDPESVAAHFRAADCTGRAAHYYVLAAARAAESLAFERAAKLYRFALQLADPTLIHEQGLRIRLGDALVNAGHGVHAAQEYLTAAGTASPAMRLQLQRQAAMQFLFSGHVSQGLDTMRSVLATIKTSFPRSPLHAITSFLLRSAILRLRGLGFQERSADHVPPDRLIHIDVLWSATIGLTMVDPISAMAFQKRQLLLSLCAGEPTRIARSLAVEVIHTATAGASASKRTAWLSHNAGVLERRIGEPRITGLVTLANGAAAFLEGRYSQARQLCEQAESIFRDRCTGVAWEISTALAFWHWSLYWLGEIAELVGRLPVLRKEAEDRGDLYCMATSLMTADQVALLAADKPDEAQLQIREFIAGSEQGFRMQQYEGLIGLWNYELYSGNGTTAWLNTYGRWRSLVSSHMLRIQQIRIHARYLRACSALAAASDSKAPSSLLRAAMRDARQLEREKVAWSQPLAALVRAGIAVRRGDQSDARQLLCGALAQFQANDMRLCAEVTRRRTGELIGGNGGLSLVNQADAWMTSQGIKNPTRMAMLFMPAFGP